MEILSVLYQFNELISSELIHATDNSVLLKIKFSITEKKNKEINDTFEKLKNLLQFEVHFVTINCWLSSC